MALANQRPDGLDPLAHAALASFTLEVDLHQEVDFLALFDDVARYINQRYDLRSTDLATLIVKETRHATTTTSSTWCCF